jgi:nucleotide-binding universal stress UspA family protein
MSAVATSLRIQVQNILFTTDFSPAADVALPYALAFTRWYGARLFVGHAVPPEPVLSVPMAHLPAEIDPYWHGARRRIEEFCRGDALRGAHYQVLMEQGELWEAVADMIQHNAVDFLVLGTHGRQGLRKLVMGSSAEQIFRLADCPVLTVGPKAARPDVKFENFKHILFATDFSPASLHALPYALSIAEENQASLTLLHLVALVPMQSQESVREVAMRQLQSLLPPDVSAWCQPTLAVRFEFPTDGILRAAAELKADLIVMGVHRTAAPRAAAHLPWAIAYDVVCGAPCPVLTVRG